MHFVNPNVTIKDIKHELYTAKKQIKEIKWNAKKYSV